MAPAHDDSSCSTTISANGCFLILPFLSIPTFYPQPHNPTTLPAPTPDARHQTPRPRLESWLETTSAQYAAPLLLVPSMSLVICDLVRILRYQTSRYHHHHLLLAISSSVTSPRNSSQILTQLLLFQTQAIVLINVSTAVTSLLEGTLLARARSFPDRGAEC